MEKETKVVPYRVNYICDKCGEGRMFSNGIMRMSNPPKWEHYCENRCGNMQNLTEQYPVIRYKDEGE